MEQELNFLPERNEVKHAYADHSKLKEVFGVNASVSIEEGIYKMASWVKEIGVRSSAEFSNIEIHENLPSSWISKA